MVPGMRSAACKSTLKPSGMAGFGEQLLRLRDVALHDVAAIGVGRVGQDRIVVAGRPEAEKCRIDDRLAVDDELHGLADTRIVERLDVHEHAHGDGRTAQLTWSG